MLLSIYDIPKLTNPCDHLHPIAIKLFINLPAQCTKHTDVDHKG